MIIYTFNKLRNNKFKYITILKYKYVIIDNRGLTSRDLIAKRTYFQTIQLNIFHGRARVIEYYAGLRRVRETIIVDSRYCSDDRPGKITKTVQGLTAKVGGGGGVVGDEINDSRQVMLGGGGYNCCRKYNKCLLLHHAGSLSTKCCLTLL